ncbi:MAG: ABC transporter ATP-binding protein [Chthoniobacteraceae bacterium]|nr:ABC transporter ATP-binding protein [Chthoniobacteraceae bacterium]
MSEPLVRVRNLTRRFGLLNAVRGISFDIYPGQVVGFIGANGAGKTTTMRMMATLEVPTSGSISIGGRDVINFPNEVRRLVGWMPDAYGTYENMTVLEYLDFYARAFGFRCAERRERIGEVMEFANLTELAARPMNRLSKGMAQRLCLGRTLLHDPPFLILDEPAAGLDPQARIEFKHLVRLLAEEGKTLFISSHILSELGEMCDTMLFIDAGRIVHYGSAESLRAGNTAGPVLEVRVAGEPEALLQWAAMSPGVTLVEATRQGARLRVEKDDPETLAALLHKMIHDGLAVTEFHKEERRLEDAFVDLLHKVGGHGPR